VRAESDSLRDALAARKEIERAKGLLMERDGLTEAEAFARMRSAAQHTGKTLHDIAQAVSATYLPQ
jgi:response regulator NasT